MKKKKILPIFLLLLILFSNIHFKLSNIIDEKSQITERIKPINAPIPPPVNPVFIYGIKNEPYEIDPHTAWSVSSYDIIHQVCETLFAYNLSDPNFPMIPRLASDFGTWDGPNPDGTWNYTVSLISGVLFHDGTPFNATAVQFSFDRLNYFIENDLSDFAELYKYYDITNDVEKLILNRTEVLGEYSVRFILNDVYAPFEALLAFTGSSILSPLSTPPSSIIDLNTGDLVGTGPFIYDGYTSGIQIDFHANENYRDGKADIDTMIFQIIFNDDARNTALLAGDIHFINNPLDSFLSMFEADPNIILLDSGITSATGNYIGMNNYWINYTFRQAISYAINYTYIIEEIRNGRAERLRSPIPEGILFANSSLDVAYCNITKARMIMQDMGFGVGWDPTYLGSDETAWTSTTFVSFNFSYYTGNTLMEDLLVLLTYNLDLIGIEVIDAGMSFQDYVYILYEYPPHTRLELQLFWFAWIPDYNDPSNYINNFFSNRTTVNNLVMYDGYDSAIKAGRDPFELEDNVQLLMDNALFELDQTARKGMYDKIQELLIEEDMPCAYLFVPHRLHAHDSKLSGFLQNPLEITYFYPCNWSIPPPPPPPISILIDDSDPEYNWSKTAAENDWCSGSGTWGDPYIIQDLEIDGQGTNDGIWIRNSNVFFKIKNCTVYNGLEFAIRLSNASNSIINNNSFYDTPNGGIWVEIGNNHTIEDNKIWNILMGYGIMLMGSNHSRVLHNSVMNSLGGVASGMNFDTFIFGNIVMNNQIGIVTGLTYNTTIEQNDVIGSLMLGIGLQETNDTIIRDNFITNNGDFGILIMSMFNGCISNTIVLNQIYNHDMIGIALDELTNQNIIFQNEFIGNLVNAIDNGTLNSWDNGTVGNFWDDYIGVDADDNGIGDIPYLIDGTAGSMDHFPIYDGPEDFLIITIIEPNSQDTYGSDAPDFSISIIGTDINKTWYTLDLGVTNITFSGLTGTFEQAEWDKLETGTHTIRFYANNSKGQIFFNEVIITKDIEILPPAPPEIPGANLFVVIPIILIAIIGLGLRHKKKFN